MVSLIIPKTEPDFQEIYPNLWMGSRQTSSMVNFYKFDMVVFCAIEYQPYPEEYLPAQTLLCPFDDLQDTAPDPEELKQIYWTAHAVAEQVLAGKKVLVTCMAGLNRSGLVTALALNILTGWSGETCINTIRQKRKPLNFLGIPLYNDAFVEILMSIRA